MADFETIQDRLHEEINIGLVGLYLARSRCSRIDVTVIAEKPVIAPIAGAIKGNLARALELPVEQVSVKATRPEGLGLAGDGVGCIAIAVLTAS